MKSRSSNFEACCCESYSRDRSTTSTRRLRHAADEIPGANFEIQHQRVDCRGNADENRWPTAIHKTTFKIMQQAKQKPFIIYNNSSRVKESSIKLNLSI